MIGYFEKIHIPIKKHAKNTENVKTFFGIFCIFL